MGSTTSEVLVSLLGARAIFLLSPLGIETTSQTVRPHCTATVPLGLDVFFFGFVIYFVSFSFFFFLVIEVLFVTCVRMGLLILNTFWRCMNK